MYSGALMSAKLRQAATAAASTAGPQRSETLKPRRSQAKRQWSIQAVKGKVTTRCLWNACKALTIGILLIFIGAGMATVGYYAEEEELRRQSGNGTSGSSTTTLVVNVTTYTLPLPPHTINRGSTSRVSRPPPPHVASRDNSYSSTNSTINNTVTTIITNGTTMFGNGTTSRPAMGRVFPPEGGFGLNKLSYVGPIVMGFGGFVIVAACVMTFEARDSAAKIVPARFRKTYPERKSNEEDSGMRNSSCQTKWETLGLYGSELMRHQSGRELSRRAMTFAFIQFSKNLQTSMDSAVEYYDSRGSHPKLVKCPSAPSLVRPFHQGERRMNEPPRVLKVTARPAHPPHSPRGRLTPNSLPRQAMSVDNPAVREVYNAAYTAFIGERGDEDLELGASATGVHQAGSEASLAMDLHLPQCSVTLAVRDQSRSPSNTRTDFDEPSAASPLLDPDMEAAGPSGLSCIKVDKQTSTSDHLSLGLLGISRCDTWGSRDISGMSGRATSGGSFREARRPRPSRRVRRSETIDTATAAARRSQRHYSGSGRHGSVRSSSSRSAAEARRLHNTRSETARRHQFLRQQKIENGESHEDIAGRGHFDV
ncbi:uncharacterized protein LOC121868269 [Homarus americanus]|uniref:uncharacterized protein LOC121868269 n=1 Tax=Homarus americanus TaxID=6706 RepID=UPI001C4857AE|nr:uncharacterized protein LOC121868269 [Homarus americanus]XP_042224624.1 uncharacterized protein LOC121868269 [Homarus americanus]